MEQEYSDARLRDLSESWVCVTADSLQPPAGRVIKGRRLAGFLTVDPHIGFRLFVEGEFNREKSGAPTWGERWVAWQIDYVDLRTLPMEPLCARDIAGLGLPERPWGMPARTPSAVMRCRNYHQLDAMRAPGHPDVVKIWVKIGDNCRGESLLARMESEEYPDVYHCTLLSAPSDSRYLAGTRVIVAHFTIKGERGLYCAWEA